MDASSLQAFVAVAETGSFSAAAVRLHLTQPAISKRIAALEQRLQQRLFDRHIKPIRVTEAGNILLQAAHDIQQTSEDAENRIRSLGTEIGGRLRIATSHHVGIHRLPQPLRDFTGSHPAVELDLKFTDSELAAEDVRQGQVELAVATLPVSTPDGLEALPIWHDELNVVVGKDHPLVQYKKISVDDLQQHAAVLPSRGTITREVIDRLLKGTHALHVALETNYLETIRVMVSVGLGWSVLPSSMLDGEIKAVAVDQHENHNTQLTRTLGIIRSLARTPSVAATEFVSMLRANSEFDSP